MKWSKTFLIIQCVSMYIMHLPLYIVEIISRFSLDEALYEQLLKALLLTFVILACLFFPICITGTVVSIISVLKGETPPSKTVMAVKLALIPWYAMNFVFSLSVFGILVVPFLLFAIPIALAVFMSITYVYMLSTSIADISYFFYKTIRKELQPDFLTALSVAFLFIFCLDVVGSIIFHKKITKTLQPTAPRFNAENI